MNPQFEQAQQMGMLWLELMMKMMAGGVTADPNAPPAESARRLRDVSLEALGQQADKYMRSPQFLEFIKQSLDAQIAMRRQLNEFFTEAHHGVQGVAKQDVDHILQSVRHMETRVLDRVEGLCDRLDQVTRRLDALEPRTRKPAGNGHAQREAQAADASVEPGKE